MSKLDGYILVHWHRLSRESFFNFDIIVHKKHKEYDRLKGFGYESGCPMAETFLETHKDYIHMCSEDLGHISNINFAILEWITELVKEGLKLKWIEK